MELGLDKASKLEGRNTAQGLIGVIVKGNCASMVELNCETDFVARNAQFHELLNEVALATHTAGSNINLEGGKEYRYKKPGRAVLDCKCCGP